MPAMRPICVRMPVASASASACPAVTVQPMYTSSPAALSTGALSPVSIDSSHRRPAALTTRASAGMRAPSSSSSTSPGTTVSASTVCSRPSRRTRAAGAAMRPSASSVRSVRHSCTKPISAFTNTMAIIATASAVCPSAALTSVAAARIRIITSLNCEKNIAATPGFLPCARRFGPSFCSRSAACRAESPLFFSCMRAEPPCQFAPNAVY